MTGKELKELNDRNQFNGGREPKYYTGMDLAYHTASIANRGTSVGNRLEWEKQFTDAGYGKSRFDNGMALPNYVDEDALKTLQDTRASAQSGIEQLGLSLTKMVGLAATTFIDNTAGFLVGLANSLVNGGDGGDIVHNFIDNPLSRALNDFNNWMDEVMPQYKSTQYQENEENGDWLKNIGTMNFWGDNIIKNAGFMIGTMATGDLAAAGMAKAFGTNTLRQVLKNSVKEAAAINEAKGFASSEAKAMAKKEIQNSIKTALEGGGNIDDVASILHTSAKKLRRNTALTNLVSSLVAANGEARLEALQNGQEFDNLKDVIEDKYQKDIDQNKVYEQILSEDPSSLILTSDGYVPAQGKEEWVNNRFNQITSKAKDLRDGALNRLADDKKTAMNVIYGANLATLFTSDALMFSKTLGGGFKFEKSASNLIRKETNKEVINRGENDALASVIERETNAALNPLGGIASGRKYAMKKTAGLKGLGKTLFGPVREMMEEMSQGTYGEAGKSYIQSDLNEFYGYKLNKDGRETSIGLMNSLADGFNNTFLDKKGWEQGFAGFVTPLLGMPRVHMTHDNGKRKLKFQYSNELIDGIKDYKKERKRANAIADSLNKAIENKKYNILIDGLSAIDKMSDEEKDAIIRNDKFDAISAKDKEFITFMDMYNQLGRINEIEDALNDFASLDPQKMSESDKSVAAKNIKEVTRINESSPYDNMNDDEILAKVSKNAKENLEKLQKYKEISDDIRSLYGSNPSEIGIDDDFNEDYMSEMIYTTSMVNTFEERFSSILKKNKNNITNLLKNENIKNKLFSENNEESTKIIDELMSSKTASDVFNKYNTQHIRDAIKLMVNSVEKSEAKAKYKSLINDLKDLQKIYDARTKYLNKLNKLQENPIKFVNNASKLTGRIVDNIRTDYIAGITEEAQMYENIKDFSDRMNKLDEEDKKDVIDKIRGIENNDKIVAIANLYDDVKHMKSIVESNDYSQGFNKLINDKLDEILNDESDASAEDLYNRIDNLYTNIENYLNNRLSTVGNGENGEAEKNKIIEQLYNLQDFGDEFIKHTARKYNIDKSEIEEFGVQDEDEINELPQDEKKDFDLEDAIEEIDNYSYDEIKYCIREGRLLGITMPTKDDDIKAIKEFLSEKKHSFYNLDPERNIDVDKQESSVELNDEPKSKNANSCPMTRYYLGTKDLHGLKQKQLRNFDAKGLEREGWEDNANSRRRVAIRDDYRQADVHFGIEETLASGMLGDIMFEQQKDRTKDNRIRVKYLHLGNVDGLANVDEDTKTIQKDSNIYIALEVDEERKNNLCETYNIKDTVKIGDKYYIIIGAINGGINTSSDSTNERDKQASYIREGVFRDFNDRGIKYDENAVCKSIDGAIKQIYSGRKVTSVADGTTIENGTDSNDKTRIPMQSKPNNTYRPLNEVATNEDKKNLYIGIIKKNGNSQIVTVPVMMNDVHYEGTNLGAMEKMDGSAVIYIKGADGIYYPTLCNVSNFDMKWYGENKNSPISEKINEYIRIICNNDIEITERLIAKLRLKDCLYLRNLEIKIEQNEVYVLKNGQRISVGLSSDSLRNELLNSGVKFNISSYLLRKRREYNDDIINSNIILTNLVDLKLHGASFDLWDVYNNNVVDENDVSVIKYKLGDCMNVKPNNGVYEKTTQSASFRGLKYINCNNSEKMSLGTGTRRIVVSRIVTKDEDGKEKIEWYRCKRNKLGKWCEDEKIPSNSQGRYTVAYNIINNKEHYFNDEKIDFAVVKFKVGDVEWFMYRGRNKYNGFWYSNIMKVNKDDGSKKYFNECNNRFRELYKSVYDKLPEENGAILDSSEISEDGIETKTKSEFIDDLYRIFKKIDFNAVKKVLGKVCFVGKKTKDYANKMSEDISKFISSDDKEGFVNYVEKFENNELAIALDSVRNETNSEEAMYLIDGVVTQDDVNKLKNALKMKSNKANPSQTKGEVEKAKPKNDDSGSLGEEYQQFGGKVDDSDDDNNDENTDDNEDNKLINKVRNAIGYKYRKVLDQIFKKNPKIKEYLDTDKYDKGTIDALRQIIIKIKLNDKDSIESACKAIEEYFECK